MKKYYCKCGKEISWQTFRYGLGQCKKCGYINIRGKPRKKKYNILKEFLRIEYIINEKSLSQVAKIIGCDLSTIGRRLKECNLLARDCGARLGKPNLKIRGKGNGMFGRLPANVRFAKYKSIWMRSSWEVAYAKWLDKKGIKWQYEPRTFDLKTDTYTPDFYLPKQKLYVEIKGRFLDQDRKKVELFRRLNSNLRFKILREKELKKLKIL